MNIQLTRDQAHALNPLIHATDPARSIENCAHALKFCIELISDHPEKLLHAFESLRSIDSVFDYETAYYYNEAASA